SVETAILVDLEKCRYSYPALDLAHATLYTSTTWEAEGALVLSAAQIAAFYATWAEALGPQADETMHGWNLMLRRAMWLWSVTWCAKWRVLSGGNRREAVKHSDASRRNHEGEGRDGADRGDCPNSGDRADASRKRKADGEDWSEALSDAALIHHVRERVDHYLSPSVVQHVLEGFDAF
ncbi:MAG: hypothetical protein ABIW85_11500, partial [Variovorax sp.]